MSKATTKSQVTLRTVETFLSEVEEKYRSFHESLRRLRITKPGSDGYLDALADVNTEVFTLSVGAKAAFDVVEEFEESLPDED